MKYAFMQQHVHELRLSSVLKFNRSGYYAWQAQPLLERARADEVLLTSIRQSYEVSGGVYGSLCRTSANQRVAGDDVATSSRPVSVIRVRKVGGSIETK